MMPLHYVRYADLVVIAIPLLLAWSYAAERWCCLLGAWLDGLLWRSLDERAFLLTCSANVHWESFGFVVAQVPEALRRVPV